MQEVAAVLAIGLFELLGQLVHGAEPVTALNVAALHAKHVPPSAATAIKRGRNMLQQHQAQNSLQTKRNSNAGKNGVFPYPLGT